MYLPIYTQYIVHGQDLFCIYSKRADYFFKSFWGITWAMSEIMRNPSKSSVDEICHISQLFVYKSHWGLLRLNQSIYQKYIYTKIFVIHRRSFDMFIIFSYVSCLFTYKPKCKQKTNRNFKMVIFGHETTKNQLFIINLCLKIFFRNFFNPICWFWIFSKL